MDQVCKKFPIFAKFDIANLPMYSVFHFIQYLKCELCYWVYKTELQPKNKTKFKSPGQRIPYTTRRLAVRVTKEIFPLHAGFSFYLKGQTDDTDD